MTSGKNPLNFRACQMEDTMAKFFGFAVSDRMFDGDVLIKRESMTVAEMQQELLKGGVASCLNPGHQATVDAAVHRYGLSVEVPEHPADVELHHGDVLLVMTVTGLGRLLGRHEYTEEEISSAKFKFARYTVL